jgi:cell pole-organizing protein PopZ
VAEPTPAKANFLQGSIDAIAPSKPQAPPAPVPVPASLPEPVPVQVAEAAALPPAEPEPASIEALVAPEAAAAASASVNSLLRTLSAERHAQVYRGGPTLEDMVRELVRPMLKEWLDSNLPPMVERIVRAEIERVAGRAAL